MTILLPLQPLRIPPGWLLTYNIFFEVDPSPETMEWFNESMMLGIASHDGRFFIDMTFAPERDPNGFYRVQFLRNNSPSRRKSRPNWESVDGAKTSSRVQVVELIERFMRQASFQETSDEVA